MKMKPILFSAAMVTKILSGHKTQTRRVIKPQPDADGQWSCAAVRSMVDLRDSEMLALCPYGNHYGDYGMWVRETWALRDCGRRVSLKTEAWPGGWPVDRVQYPATDKSPADNIVGGYWWNKRPSIHMPRWASRLSLKITEVRVERLCDITDKDARAEGVDHAAPPPGTEPDEDLAVVGYPPPGGSFARDNFRHLWQKLNEKRGYGWSTNPWVWVLSFEMADQKACAAA